MKELSIGQMVKLNPAVEHLWMEKGHNGKPVRGLSPGGTYTIAAVEGDHRHQMVELEGVKIEGADSNLIGEGLIEPVE